MKKTLRFAWLGLLIPFLGASPGFAETVVEKVARTGFLTVGTRFDTIPYAYVNDKGELVGYSIDILERIRARLQSVLGRPVTLQMVEADEPGQKITLLRNGDIDIACDTSFTWERARIVDFSTPYSISGIRVLTKKGANLTAPEALAGKRVAVVPGSVAASVLQLVQPKVVLVDIYKTIEDGVSALKAGQVDAIAGDGIAMAGTILRDNPNAFEIGPEEPYARFGVGCMVPENNSTFLDEVNYSIVAMMQDYLTQNPATVEKIDRWFGASGLVPIPAEILKGFFAFTIIEHAQIPPENN
jgi:polar amino acid transport system substrate-binding protein